MVMLWFAKMDEEACTDCSVEWEVFCFSKQIEAETKWLPFLRQYFKLHFCKWILLNLKKNLTKICSSELNWQYGSIGSDNGLALIMQQAIIWTNVGMLHWCIYVSLSRNHLIPCIVMIWWCKTPTRSDKPEHRKIHPHWASVAKMATV